MSKLSVAIATFNEEENLEMCLESVKNIADEIVVVDGSSTDKTVEIAKRFGAKVIVTDNPPMFHINKQKAIDATGGDWILQLDADERVSKKLADEIKQVIAMDESQRLEYQKSLKDQKLFIRHQKIVEQRDGKIGTDGSIVAYFIPRLNFFLGKYLKHGGVYPDGVIRLFQKGRAYLPCKDVHEQFVVKGKVGWLQNPLLHKDSPTFHRYLTRNNRYVDLFAKDLKNEKTSKDLFTTFDYLLVKPIGWFVTTQVRHKGILDGYQGIVFSFFSALRFPRAYFRYVRNK